MYYQNYEQYISNILGYQNSNNMEYAPRTNFPNYEYVRNKPTYSKDIIDLYPEIYKILSPMVYKICESNTKPITKELVDKMTDEIYLNIECDNINTDLDSINIRVNVQKEDIKQKTDNMMKTNTVDNRIAGRREINSQNRKNFSNEKQINESKIDENRNKQEIKPKTRLRNTILRDLIKILILNQLLYNNMKIDKKNNYQNNRYYGDYTIQQMPQQYFYYM